MFSTTITFLVDSTQLDNDNVNPPQFGGPSLTKATAIGHPNMTVDQSGLKIQTNVLGNTEVKIGPGEDVTLVVADLHGRLLDLRFAPCALLVHKFNGTLNPDMKNPQTRPIDIPNFNISSADVPYLSYKSSDNPSWGPSGFANWPGAPMISQDLDASSKQIYVPYIEFQGSNVVAGQMQYGLAFVLTRDGKAKEYFYFDPFLVVGSATRGLGNVITNG